MSSSTSLMLGHVSTFRNPAADANRNCAKVALAQVAYIVIVPYAIVEAAISQIVKVIARCLPIDAAKYQKIQAWAAGSVLGTLWAIHSAFTNAFVKQISATEQQFATSVLKENPEQQPDPTPPPTGGTGGTPRPADQTGTNSPDLRIRGHRNSAQDHLPISIIHTAEDPIVPPGTDPISIPPLDQPGRSTIAPTDQVIDPVFIEEPVSPVLLPVKPTPAVEISSPVTTAPTSKDSSVSNILRNYELGGNAKKYSQLMEKIYNDIPEPKGDELAKFGERMDVLLEYLAIQMQEQMRDPRTRSTDTVMINLICEPENRRTAVEFFQNLATRPHRADWEDRFLKMAICTYNQIIKTNDDSLMQIMGVGILEAFKNCINRKSTEMERLYFTYVAPERMEDYKAIMTPHETLTFELMQHRRKLRDAIINTICNDSHNAASHRFYCAKLNDTAFYLPHAVLCEADGQYASYAMQGNNEEQRIIKAFRERYETPNAIYDVFCGMLYPQKGETFKFKPTMFNDWLTKKGRMDENAFTNEDMDVYKPQIIIDYLVDMGFLKNKSR